MGEFIRNLFCILVFGIVFFFKCKAEADSRIDTISKDSINNMSLNQKLLLYNLYRNLIIEQKLVNISEISQYSSRHISQVIAELQTMIDEKFLLNFHIDIRNNTLVPTNGPKIDIYKYMLDYQKFTSKMPDFVVFKSSKQKEDTFNVYADLIYNKNMTSIDSISTYVHKSMYTVMLEIQKMIDERNIKNLYINEKTDEIELSSGPRIDIYATIKKLFPDEIECPNCGATNHRQNDTCEYCGTKLH